MTTQAWARFDYQDLLLRLIEGKERYRREHVGRIARRQGNGNAHMRDSLEGEVAALEALLGPTDTAQEMAERIEDQMDKAPPQPSAEFPESYRSGWGRGLLEARGHLARYLEPSA